MISRYMFLDTSYRFEIAENWTLEHNRVKFKRFHHYPPFKLGNTMNEMAMFLFCFLKICSVSILQYFPIYGDIMASFQLIIKTKSFG